ncbi:MAG: hypothetical protein CVV60_00830 [Tenericutes bacterium HGW-Tenericutes-5]|nr:MAG: hypothetical protein CVV60_00830 [Tenericutes bacterium HGW-Tenericutes-5]
MKSFWQELFKKISSSSKEKSIGNENVIRYSSNWSNIIYILSSFYILLGISTFVFPDIYTDDDPWLFGLLFCFPFAIVHIYFGLYLQKWKILVYDDHFTYKSIAKKTKDIAYDKIEIRFLGAATRFYIDNKHIVGIGVYQSNYGLLSEKILSFQEKNNISIVKTNKNVLQVPKMLWVLVACSFVLVAIVNIIVYFEASKYFYYSLILHIVDIGFVLYMINWRIKFIERKIHFRNMFRITRIYPYENISYIYTQTGSVKLYSKQRKIAFVWAITNNLGELIYDIDSLNPKKK